MVMLGHTLDDANVFEKIRGAKEIRAAFEKALAINPANEDALRCMGRWCFAVADHDAMDRRHWGASHFRGRPPLL